jgi:hypothetical protein
MAAVEKEHEQCVRDYERGEKELARSNLASLASRIQQADAVLEHERLEKELEHLEMEVGGHGTRRSQRSEPAMYLEGSENRLYNAMKGKRGRYIVQEMDSGYEVE